MSVKLAVSAGQSVTALTEQHERLMLVHVAIDGTLTIPRLSWPWGVETRRFLPCPCTPPIQAAVRA